MIVAMLSLLAAFSHPVRMSDNYEPSKYDLSQKPHPAMKPINNNLYDDYRPTTLYNKSNKRQHGKRLQSDQQHVVSSFPQQHHQHHHHHHHQQHHQQHQFPFSINNTIPSPYQFTLHQTKRQQNYYNDHRISYNLHQQAHEKPQDGISKCSVSELHKGCSCARFQDNFSINCSNAGLTTVPKQWTDIGLTSDLITTLNLEKNFIKEINDGDFYGVKIQRLLLANNSIADLKFLSFWGLASSLETLDLSYNKLRKVPSEAIKLTLNLKTLVLTGNEIEVLSGHDFGFMQKLEVLTLDNNPISAIHPNVIAGTKSLSLLSLDNLKLTNKISEVAKIDPNNVKGLSLTRNSITTLPPRWATNFSSLTLLKLGENHISDITDDETFFGIENTLQNLDLQQNELINIPVDIIRHLAKLNVLDMSNNRLTRIKRKSFNESKNLQVLDLSHNHINKISKLAFIGLDSIQKLDLRYNRLITLDDRVFGWNFGLRKPSVVFLSNNRWLCNCVILWLRQELIVSRESSPSSNGSRRKRRRQNTEVKTNASISDATPIDKTGLMNIFADDPTCQKPKLLKGIPISRTREDELTCSHNYFYYDDDDKTTTKATAAAAAPTHLGHALEPVIDEVYIDN